MITTRDLDPIGALGGYRHAIDQQLERDVRLQRDNDLPGQLLERQLRIEHDEPDVQGDLQLVPDDPDRLLEILQAVLAEPASTGAGSGVSATASKRWA